jgi:hypothetical protein
MQIVLEVSNLDFTSPTGISRYMIELVNEFSKDNSDKITLYYKLSRLSNRLKANKLKFTFQGYDEHFWKVFRQPQIIHGLDTITPKLAPQEELLPFTMSLYSIVMLRLYLQKNFHKEKRDNFKGLLITAM